MTEQEATDKLEEIVGSIDGCFRLMRIYQESAVVARQQSVEKYFRKRAGNAGYSEEAISHYLNHIR